MFGHVEQGKVHIFFGKMGSGKTSNAVYEIQHFHKKGMPVWVNFPLTVEDEGAPIWYEPDVSGLLCMEGGLFVIDEAYMVLNSRKWKDLSDEVFLAFTHVRKLNMTVIVIAQSWKRIDLSIRELATTAREFTGGSLFGRMYKSTEYEVDEAGEIIKLSNPLLEIEKESRRRWSFFGEKTYKAFDTDHLFTHIKRKKTWVSATRGPRPTEPTVLASGFAAVAKLAARYIPGMGGDGGASSPAPEGAPSASPDVAKLLVPDVPRSFDKPRIERYDL